MPAQGYPTRRVGFPPAAASGGGPSVWMRRPDVCGVTAMVAYADFSTAVSAIRSSNRDTIVRQ